MPSFQDYPLKKTKGNVGYHSYPGQPGFFELITKNYMKTIRVVAAIIRDGDKVFATQRGTGDFTGGWEFPGGKIEDGETPQQALIREIEEELEVDVTVGDLIETIEYDYPLFHLSMDCFWCSLTKGLPVLREHAAAKWLTKDTIDSVQWLPADEGLVNKIKQALG